MSLLSLPLSYSANAQTRTYIVGAEQLDYYPHFDFDRSEDKGFAWQVLQQFAARHDIQFNYISLPPKRLQLELDKGTIDFAYPDNPRWQHHDIQVRQNKIFSQGLALGIYGTMVRQENLGQSVEQFNKLAFPIGFTPVKWQQLFKQYNIKTIETYDAAGAILAVARGRADGADIEYNVAAYLGSVSPDNLRLQLNPDLPFSAVNFSLSTFAHPELIEQLDQFLIENQELINNLKARYQLQQSIEPRDYVKAK
ncbi:substrate-binding periplasmic protein [Alteromonas ponticola]|uniref:Transporter substrate-binding domain-containing protein n=1 Tax=Alteromonas ponticola TaxID=2720613 RepID=A0ABX1QXX8_9ALTE|nr:hypothetical protein [Alteromonas ponticola]NMH59100.1 hypothetical protein [Alteromonas ponticola]